MASLTPKQQRFVEEYLLDLNSTRAAIRAGYAPKDADVQGPRLLGNVGVAAAIARAKAERSERTRIAADRVLKELARLGFSDLGEFVTWGPDGVRLLPSDAVDTRGVLEVKETVTKEGGSRSIKLHDKLGALTKLGQHLGLFEERVSLGNRDDKPFRIEDAALTDEERADHIVALLDRARARAADAAKPPDERN